MQISVNRTRHDIDAAPDVPLLSILRNDLGLTAAKYGCGIGKCGACTVLVDGLARRSCMIPLREVGDGEITTLEGLGTDGVMHPLQEAFIAEGAAQCGYCIPGIVMTAAALLSSTRAEPPALTRSRIVDALAENLCRCGSHPRIIRAVERAAVLHHADGSDSSIDPSTVSNPDRHPSLPPSSGRAATEEPVQQLHRSAAWETPREAHPAQSDQDSPSTGSAATQLPGFLDKLGMTSEVGRGIEPDHKPDHKLDRSGETVGSWIRLMPDGTITALSGKVELGTGLRIALAQIVATELGVPVQRVRMILGDTAWVPDQGYTAGSKSIQSAGMLLQRAAAAARRALLAEAARRLEISADDVVWDDGVFTLRSDPGHSFPLAALADVSLDIPVPDEMPSGPRQHSRAEQMVAGRIELPAMLDGTFRYVHDLVLDGMLHARVIRPHRRIPSGIGASIAALDTSAAEALPGVAIVRNGSFLAVVADREEIAIAAAQAVRIEWTEHDPLPDQATLFETIRRAAVVDVRDHPGNDPAAHLPPADHALRARYEVPYAAHGSMGPSCAVADVRAGRATIWSSTQGVYPLRNAIAPLIGLLPEQVRVISMEGSGCYGHNGADDASADAALVSRAVGRPVRVQWSRRDEFALEPKGSAMVSEVSGSLDGSGMIASWRYDVRTPTHSTRPGGHAGLLLAASQIDPPIPPVDRHRFGGGDRNAAHTYDIPHSTTTAHWIKAGPLHQSSLRSLGGFANTTAIESFMDELACAAGADPIAFRLRHLSDPRARAVIERVAQAAGWTSGAAHSGARNGSTDGILHGSGIAYARYEGEYAYVAMIARVSVDPSSGDVRVNRIVVAHDCGRIISHDGVANQVEGNIIQGISRTLKEEVTWDADGITSLTFESYPILTFPEVPEIDVILVDRPDEPPWGAGEPAICPVAAAIGNAISDATGTRLRRLPFTPARVAAALRQAQSGN
ncbi:MAG TPA: molybdopterin cofactor-binding domain-containing protein [Thermomicrobiales bacterium]|nr:molybdopterin cofactor-binding domain-containing protein [Thermomicrobiales bacterium]